MQTSSIQASPAADVLGARFAALLRYLFLDPRSQHLSAIEEHDLSMTQVRALFALAALPEGDESLGVCGLAERLGASAPTASRALHGLVRRGLVSRSEDERDRRVRRLEITPAGTRLVDELAALRQAGLEAFASELTAGQRRKLDAALKALLERDEIAVHYRPPSKKRKAA